MFVTCKPDCYEVIDGIVQGKEHSGRVWLWRWPELLGAPVGRGDGVLWLGVFGDARKGAPGDVWGLDTEGDLILVELKRFPKGTIRSGALRASIPTSPPPRQ